MTVRRLPTHTDARGRLLVAEDADIGFAVRRVFAITGAPAGMVRGDHRVPCRQAMVLVSGTATVWLSGDRDAQASTYHLTDPGDTLDLSDGVWVRYALSGPEAAVIVFADSAYEGRANP
ncbi:hypothetical protein BH09ACT4_BH09ACT4_14510 [soil metagenome]